MGPRSSYLGQLHSRVKTGADMLLWNGACVVHEEFKAKALELEQLKRGCIPEAGVLVHPGVAGGRHRAWRMSVGSTSQSHPRRGT